MDFVFDHFWIVFIAITFINAFIQRSRISGIVAQKPELKPGYSKLIQGYLVYMNIPWLVMGAGNIFGHVPLQQYLNLHSHNLFVLAFFVTLIVLLFFFCIWVFFRGGAAFLARHPGFIRFNFLGYTVNSTKAIKIFVVVLLEIGRASCRERG